MGLFGGFKAKFTKNSTSKRKQQDVVCLRYHIHSEFDADTCETFPQMATDTKTEVKHSHSKNKKRNVNTKSAIFTENDTTLTQLANSAPQKSLSLTNLSSNKELQNIDTDPIVVSTTFNIPSNGHSVAVSDTEFRKSTKEDNGVVTQKVALTTNKHVYTADKNMKNEQYTYSTYNEERAVSNSEYISRSQMSNSKQFTYENPVKENGLNDQSTLIFMTQHSSRSSSFDRNIENNYSHFINENNTADKRNIPAPTVEADYFKVNVVKHNLNRSYSCSDDEQSNFEEEEPHQFTRMGYSNQAASIFFGEGNETELVRPRMIQLMNEDDNEDRRRSSGAEC